MWPDHERYVVQFITMMPKESWNLCKLWQWCCNRLQDHTAALRSRGWRFDGDFRVTEKLLSLRAGQRVCNDSNDAFPQMPQLDVV
jgi:hypothetical protein